MAAPFATLLTIAFLAAPALGQPVAEEPRQADPVAGEADNEATMITMEFNGIELRQVIQFIIRGRDINIVTANALDEKITVKLVGVSWRLALESVLKAHGYTYVEDQNILRIVKISGDPADTRRVPLVLRLRHTTAEAARQVLEPLLSPEGKIVILGGEKGKTLSIIDQPQFLEVVQEILPKVDTPPRQSTSELTQNDDGTINLRLVSYPLADLDLLLQQYLSLNVVVQDPLTGDTSINLRNVTWEEALKLLLLRHDYAFRMENEVVLIGRESRFKEELVTVEFKLLYINGWDLKPYLEKLTTKEGSITCFSPQPRGGFEFGTKITERREKADDDNNGSGKARVIAVTDRPSRVAVIAERIKTLDVRPEQVEVDVKIIEIRRDNDRQTGIDWNAVLEFVGAARPTILPFGSHGGELFPGNFPATATGFSFGSISAQEMTAVLRMIKQTTDAEVVSEPNITTLDNTEASILIGQKFPVTSETIDPTTSVRTVTLDYYEDIGIQLLVVPTISDGGRVHMVIHPAVSSVSSLIEDRFPVIDTREADTQVLLRSGDTAVIGGLIERTKSEEVRSIPWLGRIPILGWFFSHTAKTETVTELVIFVTPRIVRNPDDPHTALQVPVARREVLRQMRDRFRTLLEEQGPLND